MAMTVEVSFDMLQQDDACITCKDRLSNIKLPVLIALVAPCVRPIL